MELREGLPVRNEVKAGYKKTEIGIIPEDWEVISFEKAFYFLSTASYSRAEILKNGDIKYVHYGDIHTKLEHFLDFKNFELPTIKNEQLKTYSLIKDGDLIMADASEDYEGIGKSVEVKNIENDKGISGLHTFLLRGKEGVFSNGFKAYLHSNKIIKTQYDKLATGLKVYGVSKGNLKSIQIPLPPLPEQKAIAQVLSDTDHLIQSLEKLIAKKRLIKQGAMQKLFNPKKGWVVKKLPQVCWFQEGPGLRNWQFTKNGMKVINVTNLVDGYLALEKTDRHISNKEFEKMYKHFEIDENDIVMASSGNSYSKVAVVRKQDLRLLMNTSVIRFKPLQGFDYNYLLIFLKSALFKDQIDLLITGGAQPNFGPFHLKKIDIAIPPTKEEQSSIASIISDMDAEIETLEKKQAKYKALKQGLMQNLLTGKIRLV